MANDHPFEYTTEKNVSSFWLLIALWLAGAIPEVLLHLSTSQGASQWNEGLLLCALFPLVSALALYALALLLPWRGLSFGITLLYSFLCFLFCASQLIYYKVFGCFYSAFSMANGGQVLQFWDIVLKKIAENPLWLLGMAAPFIALCIFGRHLFRFNKLKYKALFLIPAGFAVAVQLAIVFCLPLFGTGVLSPYDLYHNNSDAYFSINKLGLATAFRLDVTRLLTGTQPDGSINLDTPESTPPAQTTTEATQPETTAEETQGTTAPTIDTGPNMLDIDFDALIAGSTNSAVQEVHQYFRSRTPSSKNEHTGLFEGCNLILITAEAFSDLIITEERTPTLYKMMTEGYRFTNYYVPDWGTSTTDGEYAFLTGTIPKANVWSFSDSSDNAMPLTMSQQLIAQGYSAYAYHGHTYNYYNRDQYLANLGYTYRAYGNGLDVKYTWPESDVEVVDLTTADFTGSEPFTVYYMTISGHREFNFYGNQIAYNNQHLVEDEPYSTAVRAYLACQLELELSLQLLVERLEQAGVLENTVFVLTADHYPNGLTAKEIGELLGHEPESNFEIYKNGCIIYKPGMTPETIDEPCSHLDLLPTLSNLFGLEFDSRLYMGRDIFSDEPALVMFRNRSWITDTASYNFVTGELVNFTDTPVDDLYVEKINNEVSNRFTVSSRILDYDYWSILFS